LGYSDVLETGESVKFFAALFAIMNPMSALPIFTSLTRDNTGSQRQHIAFMTAIAVLIILLVTAVVGEQILDMFGISIGSFRVAGGIIILLMALSMLHAKQSGIHHSPEEEQEGVEKDNPALFPLAIPLIAGPGSVATVILYSQQAHGTWGYATIFAVIVVMVGIVYAALSAAIPLARFLGTTGMNVITRVMGMILAAIAVEMIAGGLGGLFPALATPTG
jgi:multiple antibiotic resistance protein